MPFPGTTQLQYAFSGGLNSIVAEASVDQPNLQNADNVIYNQTGQIDQRTGLTATSTSVISGSNIINGKALGTFNNELLMMDGVSLYSYDPDNSIWINKGTLFSTINDQIRVVNTKIATQANPDCTTLNGLQLYCYEDNRPLPYQGGPGIRYSIKDTTTGVSIVADQFVYPYGFRPKVLAVPGTNQFYLYYNASQNTIFLNTVYTNQPQILPPLQQLIIDGIATTQADGTGIAYDVCLNAGVPSIAYSGTGGIRIITGSNTNLISGQTASCIATCVTAAGVQFVAWTSIAGGTFITNINTLITTPVDALSAVNIAIIEDITPGNINITYEISGGADPNYIRNAILTSGNIIVPVGSILKLGLASKPFQVGNQLFVNTIFFTNLQATYFTICLTQNGTAIAKHSPQNGGNYRGNSLLSQCDSTGQNSFVFAGQRKGPFTSFQNAQTVNLGVAGYTIDFDNINAFNNESANNNLHIVGGIKKIYDGISCVEDNFNYFPELADGYSCDIQLTNGGGLTYDQLTQPNQYQYLVCYEWTDNAGNVYRSGPGVANTIVTTATQQSTVLKIPTLTITDKLNTRTPVIISIFRTQDSLPIFYKITDDNDPIINDSTVNYVYYSDSATDVSIAANENLYTGSQLPNTAPPSCSLIALYQNRLMINSNEDQNVVWYSQNEFEQDQYNTLPLDWNTSFIEGVNSLGDGITALAWSDNGLLIFKENAIYLLQGDGPNALDTSGQFNNAQLLSANVGCTNSNSIVYISQTPSLPGGVMFKSNKGIYLLGQDNNSYPIGAPVNQYNDLTITSANLVSGKNMVIFTTLEGTCLVYNYLFNAWTTWSDLPAIDATVWQDQLAIVTPSGNVMIQDITGTIWNDTFANNIVYPVVTKTTTPWMKPGGAQNLQGRMAVYCCTLLATLQAPCNILVQVAYDYNPSIIESCIVTSSVAANRWGGLPIWGSQGTWGSNNFSNCQFQINFKNPRGTSGGGCQAIQLTISTTPGGTEGFSLNGLALEVMPLPGQFNLPTSNKIGSQ